jgi:lipopolysaccharide transport system ATP-binding protein
MGIAIKVENLSKAYQLGEIGTGTLSNDLKRWAYKIRGKEDPFLKIGETNDRTTKGESDMVWSLKDLNFEIEQGDAIGIIGRNGAGKSTLLKILSRVTSPTTGTVKVKGRVASLLEVGTGFHPELTGRENIFLNGAILGMRKAEIKKHFDAIVDFAGVERYIETPVKRYSSGMYVRLAFAVAAHLESEILVVDEVLAVGDAEFQKKCLGKMSDVNKGDGRTILFVSHNMQSITTLTKKALLLQNGNLIAEDSTTSIIKKYINLSKNPNYIYTSKKNNDKPYIKSVRLETSYSNNCQKNGDKLSVIIEIFTPRYIRGACFSFQFSDSNERNFTHLWIFDSEKPFCREQGIHTLKCTIENLKLYMGEYFLKCYFSEPPGGEVFEVLENICPFEVVMHNTNRAEFQWLPETCAYIENANWEIY